MLHGFLGSDWEQKITVELSSALNRWYESIPNHCKCEFFTRLHLHDHVHQLTVRWDPTCTDELVFHQSTNLNLAYHQVQIAVHRAFILDAMHPSVATSSALAVCSSAARSTSRLMDAHFKRRQRPLPFYTVSSATISAASSSLTLIIACFNASGLDSPVGCTERPAERRLKCSAQSYGRRIPVH